MQIQTMSIVVGTPACDAACPFCISKQTGFSELPEIGPLNERNFAKAAELAKTGGVNSILITGKGEPTLYPDEITRYLGQIKKHLGDKIVELQSNALQIGDYAVSNKGKHDWSKRLYTWHILGLDTIAISTVGVDPNWNALVYRDPYPDLKETIRFIRSHGIQVRMSVMLQKHMVDNGCYLIEIIEFCKDNDVFQLTLTPITRPKIVEVGGEANNVYVMSNALDDNQVSGFRAWLNTNGTLIRRLMNGAHVRHVYDVWGQNVCMSSCLTVDPDSEDIRTLIFYSDGRITHDWGFKGARLL